MSFTTASTSVVLVPTATSNSPFYVYLNNVSTAGRIVTVRDNDGYASSTNRIVVAPVNGAYFVDGTSSITINQPYGYITFNTALNGGYGILNTFGFPSGSAAAFVSNITSCNLTTNTLGAQFISAPTAVFNTVNVNTISTGNIIINNFTPSTIAANSISTGSITGGSVSFQTIFGSTIATNGLTLASLTATTGNFTNVITSNTTTSNLLLTGDVVISATGSNVQIGSNTAVGSRGVAVGGNAKAATDAVSLGFAAGSNNQGTMATSVGGFAGATNQGANAIAVGYTAGSNTQGSSAVAVGFQTGNVSQGVSAVAIGDSSGYQNQGNYTIAIGAGTAMFSQGTNAISLGGGAGQNTQGASAIAIGSGAGQNSQGSNAIAIGTVAGQTNQHASTIIINATGSVLNSATTNSVYIAPIRDDQTGVGSRVAVYYNQATKEMTTGPATGTNLLVSSIITSSIVTNGLTTIQLLATSLQTNTISMTTLTGSGISTISISTGTTLTGTIQTNTISSGTASFGLGNVSTINTNSISTASLNVGSLNVNSLSTGSITLATASIGSLATNTISSGTIIANSGTISTFTAGSIIANTERVGSLSTNFISANIVNITGPTSMINARTQNLFVANGNDSVVDLKYSLDGITWCNSVTNGGFSSSGSGVAWNGSMFVAVGNDSSAANTIKYSMDGSNWFNSASGGFSISGIHVAWNGRMWVATGQDASSQGRIKYSFNGSNWFNANTTTFTSYGNKVAWGNGRWVVAGVDAGGAANSIMTSIDGSNWAFATNTTGGSATSPVYNGQLWLMGANGTNSNAILYSSNALTWNRVESTAFTTGCYEIGWNGSYWVALGEGGATIQTSQNGMVWTPATSGLFNQFGGPIVWNGSYWVAGGFDTLSVNARIKYSYDGLNWTNTVFGAIPYTGSANGLAYTNQLIADVTTQEMNIFSQNVPNVLQSTNQILALTSSMVLNNTLYVNKSANYVGINASVPQAPLHVVGGLNGQTSQILLQTLGSTLNTSLYISTNVGQATLGVVGPSNGFMTGTVPGDTVLTTARVTNRLVLGNDASIGLFISSGTVVVPGSLAIGGSISTTSISTGSASFDNITVRSSTLVSTLFFTGDVSIQAATSKIRIGSNAGRTTQNSFGIAIGGGSGQTSQGFSAVAIGLNAGATSQGATTVAIGEYTGETSQGVYATAVGAGAGRTTQGTHATSIGSSAGSFTQGQYATAIGDNAGSQSQGQYATAIGTDAGNISQGIYATAIGSAAGMGSQGQYAIAIGVYAGQDSQGANAIAIGNSAGTTSQHANSIILNATGSALESATTNALYVAPIRNDQGITGARTMVYYNQTTKEITTGPTTSLVLSSLTVAGAVAFPSVSTNTLSTTTVNAATLNTSIMNASTISAATIQVNLLSSVQLTTSNIGVGVAVPSTLVHINGGPVGSAGSTQFMITGTGGTPNTAMNIRNVSGQAYFGVAGTSGQYLTGTLAGDTFIRTDETLTTKKLLLGNGNGTPGITLSNNFVGINNTSPSYQLDVNGQVWARSTFYVGSNTSNNEIRFYGTTGENPGSFITTVISERLYSGTESSELLLFKADNSDATNGPDRVRVLAAGGFQVDAGNFTTFLKTWSEGGGPPPTATYSNALRVSGTNGFVGIGTGSPAYNLDVTGAINTNSGLLVSSFATNNIFMTLNGAGTSLGYIFGQTFDNETATCIAQNYFYNNVSLTSSIQNNLRGTSMIALGAIGGMRFFTGDTNKAPTERMRITLTGNVGIGTASPAYTLDIVGETRIQPRLLIGDTSSTSGSLRLTPSVGDFYIQVGSNLTSGSATKLRFATMATSDTTMTIDLFNDRVGIGTTSPSYPLDVNGRTWLRSTLYLGSSGTANEIRFNGTTGDQAGFFTYTAISERIYDAGTENSELLLFKGNDDGQDVGIGPDRVRVLASGGFQVDCGGNYEWVQGGGAPPTAQFSNALRVSGSNGFVGIRTGSPAYPLHVVGGTDATLLVQGAVTSANTSIMLSNAGGYFGQFCLASSTGSYNPSALLGDAVIRTTSAFPTSKIILNNGSTGLGLCLSNNCVGIGKVPNTSPVASVQLDLSTDGARKLLTSSWATGSDERIKKNIVLADSFICYSTIKQIPLKYFEWSIYDPSIQSTIQTDDVHSLGFIAQDVEKVFANAVKQSEEYGFSNFRTLNNDQVFKMHYGATQYLGQEVERQSTIIQTLTTQVAELQQAVSTLMGRVTV